MEARNLNNRFSIDWHLLRRIGSDRSHHAIHRRITSQRRKELTQHKESLMLRSKHHSLKEEKILRVEETHKLAYGVNLIILLLDIIARIAVIISN